MPQFKFVNQPIPVQQHLVLPFYWQASFHPAEKGWNEFSATGMEQQRLYVYDADAWKAVNARELIEQNALFAKQQQEKSEKQELLVENVEKSVSKWVFFAFFLISVAFLWFETKILQ